MLQQLSQSLGKNGQGHMPLELSDKAVFESNGERQTPPNVRNIAACDSQLSSSVKESVYVDRVCVNAGTNKPEQ